MNQPASRLRAALEARRGRAIVPYITAGDPDLATTYELVLALDRAGAAAIEIGVPFSDPVADGPVIQRACVRALQNRVTVADVLDLTREISGRISCPLVLFSYVNPLLQHGLRNLLTSAQKNGISGLLLTDLPIDSAPKLVELAQQNDVDVAGLAAPTCSEARLERICNSASGFIYAIASTGVTGVRDALSGDAQPLAGRIRRYTSLPVAVGFGINTPARASEVLQFADAAVVGSALVTTIEKNLGTGGMVSAVEKLAYSFCHPVVASTEKPAGVLP